MDDLERTDFVIMTEDGPVPVAIARERSEALAAYGLQAETYVYKITWDSLHIGDTPPARTRT